jgi:hypothetical protein
VPSTRLGEFGVGCNQLACRQSLSYEAFESVVAIGCTDVVLRDVIERHHCVSLPVATHGRAILF